MASLTGLFANHCRSLAILMLRLYTFTLQIVQFYAHQRPCFHVFSLTGPAVGGCRAVGRHGVPRATGARPSRSSRSASAPDSTPSKASRLMRVNRMPARTACKA